MYASPHQEINGAVFLALCPVQVTLQDPNNFESSKMQTYKIIY